MNTAHALILIAATALNSARAAATGDKPVTLYQVGKNGNYCLSLTPNAGGCVSGSKFDGSTINVLNFVKGRTVVFENLSDAPHDMKFSGANAEEMPAQFPNGPLATKAMSLEDLLKQKITCNFHGAQLAVGYSVAGAAFDPISSLFSGHQSRVAGGGDAALKGAGAAGQLPNFGGPNGLGNVATTGLADVSRVILAKGAPSEVASLLSARPELMGQLQEVRPLLAGELRQAAADGRLIGGKALPPGLANAALIQTGVGLAAADSFETAGARNPAGLDGAAGTADSAAFKNTGSGKRLAANALASIAGRRAQPGEDTEGDGEDDFDSKREASISDGAALASLRFGNRSRTHRSTMSLQDDPWSFSSLTDPAGWRFWLIAILLFAIWRVMRASRRSRRRAAPLAVARRKREENRDRAIESAAARAPGR